MEGTSKQVASEIELLELQWRDKLFKMIKLAKKLAYNTNTIERADLILELQRHENSARAANDWSMLPEVKHREARIQELEEKVLRLEREKWELQKQIQTQGES